MHKSRCAVDTRGESSYCRGFLGFFVFPVLLIFIFPVLIFALFSDTVYAEEKAEYYSTELFGQVVTSEDERIEYVGVDIGEEGVALLVRQGGYFRDVKLRGDDHAA